MKKAKEDRDLTDLVSLVQVPGDREGHRVCQLLYVISQKNNYNSLVTLAFKKAQELGFDYMEATDLMGNFNVVQGDQFGFEQIGEDRGMKFMYMYNYNVPVNILPGAMGMSIA